MKGLFVFVVKYRAFFRRTCMYPVQGQAGWRGHKGQAGGKLVDPSPPLRARPRVRTVRRVGARSNPPVLHPPPE